MTLINNYALHVGAPKYVKQILMDVKAEINRNTVIVGDYNTPLTSMDTSYRKKINKEIVALNHTPGQMDLNCIFRAFHAKAAEYIYFSSAHRMFPRIDHMLGQETSLNEFKKIEIISSILSDNNAMKLKIKPQAEH